ncbi:uncharacterized protein SAPINGB_P002974 [Magnusiomyces paraingens]|uniref:Uncharacterized protein n=1 Tax=Magnusiomyces paraingens TaxID=2606893 RepID=A0A5E8BIP9_9ASCO|nr:uncharacterized protein SAPINGB_P002974 [Saprochaete ingens]VVT51071.1 unnamed protein product [Saprochaete ingens]
MNFLSFSQPSIISECVSSHRSTLQLPVVCSTDSSLTTDDLLTTLSFDPSSTSISISTSTSTSTSTPNSISTSSTDAFFQSSPTTINSTSSSTSTFDQDPLNSLLENSQHIPKDMINSFSPEYTWDDASCSPTFSNFSLQTTSDDSVVHSTAVATTASVVVGGAGTVTSTATATGAGAGAGAATATATATAVTAVENNFLSSPALPLMVHQPSPELIQSLQMVPPLSTSAPSPPPTQLSSSFFYGNSTIDLTFGQPIHSLPGYPNIDSSISSSINNHNMTLNNNNNNNNINNNVLFSEVVNTATPIPISQGQLFSTFSDNYDDASTDVSIYVPPIEGTFLDSRKNATSFIDPTCYIVDQLTLPNPASLLETSSFAPQQHLSSASTLFAETRATTPINDCYSSSCAPSPCAPINININNNPITPQPQQITNLTPTIPTTTSCHNNNNNSNNNNNNNNNHNHTHGELDHNGRPPRKFTKRRYRCNHCDATFFHTCIDEYVQHVLDAEAESSRSAVGRIYKCDDPTCPWAHIGFTRKLEKKRHMDRKHKPPRYECRYWTQSGTEAFPEAGRCASRWHADIGSRRRHETNVHGRPWDDTCALKARENKARNKL